MATIQQIQALEFIEQKKKQAKIKKVKLADYLSNGHQKYKTAINAIISVGALSIVSAFIGILWATVGLVAMLYQNVALTTNDWIMVICEFGVYLITIILGTKLYRLDVTPTFVLSSLIILLVLNAVVFMGILPCFTVLFCIIGIICLF